MRMRTASTTRATMPAVALDSSISTNNHRTAAKRIAPSSRETSSSPSVPATSAVGSPSSSGTNSTVREGIATATVVDPMCKPTATHRCDLRLEALQLSLIATPGAATGEQKFADAIIATTTPLDVSVSGNGGDFIDPPLSVSFGENGDRAPLLDSKGSIHVIIYPSTDGTVRLGLSGHVPRLRRRSQGHPLLHSLREDAAAFRCERSRCTGARRMPPMATRRLAMR